MIMRRIARPMLAAIFVSGGIEQLRNPKPPMQAAEPVVDKTVGKVEDKLPDEVPTDTESLVKIDAVVKIGAGLALALNTFPRLAALLLAGSLIPTTAVAHRFWECEDPQERAAQRTHFVKNVGLLGGLMIAAGDTHGKPSLAWRTKHAASAASGTVAGSTAAAAGKLQELTDTATGKAQQLADTATGKAQKLADTAGGKAQKLADTASGKVQEAAGSVKGAAKGSAKGFKAATGTAKSLLPG
jgi:putative oxidoreductase